LLLTVLNPYSVMSELDEIFRLLLAADPKVAMLRDGFGLSAFQWSNDYINIAQQHQLKVPNPAAFLSLMPLLCSNLPEDVDAGEACLKVAKTGQTSAGVTKKKGIQLRFLEGDRVLARVENPGGKCDWEEGVVIGLWYREPCWPSDHPGAPYEVQLDIGTRLFALADSDRIIRREAGGRPKGVAATTFAPPSRSKPGSDGKAKAASGPRFQRRKREDGTWEMLDTVSGKTRPVSPPESDADDSD